jgi:hypothetical protein
MCSNVGRAYPPSHGEDELATRLAAVIDELAATVRGGRSTDRDGAAPELGAPELAAPELAAPERTAHDGAGQERSSQDRIAQDRIAQDYAEQDHAEQDLAERLAHAWAMITAADPELAARAARYARP